MHSTPFEQLAVEFKDVHIHQATLLSGDGSVTLGVGIHPGSGRFELSDNTNNIIVTGRVRLASQPVLKLSAFLGRFEGSRDTERSQKSDVDLDLSTKDFYGEMRVHGYDYGPAFQGVRSTDQEGSEILQHSRKTKTKACDLIILSPFEHRIRPILGPIRKSNIFSVFAVYVTHKFSTFFVIFCS